MVLAGTISRRAARGCLHGGGLGVELGHHVVQRAEVALDRVEQLAARGLVVLPTRGARAQARPRLAPPGSSPLRQRACTSTACRQGTGKVRTLGGIRLVQKMLWLTWPAHSNSCQLRRDTSIRRTPCVPHRLR